ncbi:sugar ABC transporter ATP-binding protein [Vibrio rumoiensis]|uniref:sugar ABC transporter ATP-binding protein n=1 Tax=Vibrio rumoiensis TaxID=76258 RepID=UPI000B5C7919|nr:sugar ABC transporter ATP-binding protein [Vibrio rumoiensis]
MDTHFNDGTDHYIRISKLTKSFGGHKALNDVDFTLNYGEVRCLAGTNGSGKSTLIKIICGVHKPDPGAQISIDGVATHNITPNTACELGVQVIYQDLSLFPNLSVAENIAFTTQLTHRFSLFKRKNAHDIAQRLIEEFQFDLDLDARVEDLPIAQRQQIAICRALVSEAKLVIMDEPTASLTRTEVNQLLSTVNRLKAKGIAVIFVSHKLDEVLEISDNVSVIKDGVMVGTYPAAEVTPLRLTELMTGLSISHQKRNVEVAKDAPVVMKVEGLIRANQYQDINFELKLGQVIGLCGLLGSGRTELALSLFGITKPDSGRIFIDGIETQFENHQDAIKKGIGYVSEDRLTLGLILEQSVSDNTVVSIMDQLVTPAGLIDEPLRQKTVSEWIQNMGVKVADLSLPISSLSGGNQQKVVLAKWILTQPKILILDSPTVGVDVGAKDSIYQLVEQLSRQGVSVILISDEVSEVYYNCDKVFHFEQGKIISEFDTHSVTEHELMETING